MNTKNEAYPDNNPKTVLGVAKVPLHLVPPSASYHLATAFADGAKKYGPYNWRDKTVSSSIYIAAAKRHIDAWWDGEEVSSDAQVHHLAHALACLAIILDATSVGKINDDRPTKGAASYLQTNYVDKEKQKNAATKPVQWIGKVEPGAVWEVVEHKDSVVYRRVPDVQENLRPADAEWNGGVAGYGKPGNCS